MFTSVSLDLQVVHGAGVDLFSRFLATRSATTLYLSSRSSLFGLVDLQVDASVILSAHYPQESAERASCLTTAANDVAHVFLVHVKGDEHAHLIDGALGLHVIRVIDESFDNELYEILILHAIHVVFQIRILTSAVDLDDHRGEAMMYLNIGVPRGGATFN